MVKTIRLEDYISVNGSIVREHDWFIPVRIDKDDNFFAAVDLCHVSRSWCWTRLMIAIDKDIGGIDKGVLVRKNQMSSSDRRKYRSELRRLGWRVFPCKLQAIIRGELF